MAGGLNDAEPRSFAFGPFVLVPEQQSLRRDGAPVRIGGRALEILTALVETPGELVGKYALFARVWPETTVDESNLKVNIAVLRRALGEGPGTSRYIGTVVGRGYRFLAPVHRGGTGPPPFEAGDAPADHNLPAGTIRIVGRDDVIATLRRELEEVRLVSIVGAGGIGKTTTALAVAEGAIGGPRDGVWLVEFAPLKDPALVPNAIATAIGFSARSPDMLDALCTYLRARRMLLVLDSCEHVVDAVAHCVARILAAAAGVTILATSREPLRVKGERIRRLPGLAVPPVLPDLRAAQALTFPAVELFVERAIDALGSFDLRDADAPFVAEICRKLDGLALAIELAAALVDMFGVAGLLNQLDDRFQLLKGFRAGPERHRTLMATIDWSHDLLSPGEQVSMRRLSVFAGAFDLRSACAVVADDPAAVPKVVDDVAGLVSKSIVTIEPGDVEVRYRLLDTTRAYAAEKLAAVGETETMRRRHAEHVLERTRTAEENCDLLPKAEWRTHHAAELNDLRSALAWAFGDTGDGALGVKLTVAAIPFWNKLSHVEECRNAIERARLQRFVVHRSAYDDLVLDMELGRTLFQTRGPLPEGRAIWVRILDYAERGDDFASGITSLTWLANYDLWAGEFRSVVTLAERFRQLAIARGQVAIAESIDRQAGFALRYLGDFDAARRCLERAIGWQDKAGGRIVAGQFVNPRRTALGVLAVLDWIEGRPDQAVTMARQQREEAEADDDAVSLCSAIVEASCPLALYVGDLELAARLLDTVERITTDHGLDIWRSMVGCLRGQLLLQLGDAAGLEQLREHLTKLRGCGFRLHAVEYLGAFAEGLARNGDADGARHAADEAAALIELTGQLSGRPELLRIRGTLLHAADGERLNVARYYREAINAACALGAPAYELRAAISLVELSRESGGDEEAEQMLSSVYARFDEGFGSRDLRRARALLGVGATRRCQANG